MFIKHVYGHRKTEIRDLLRKKISHNNKKRYHEKQYRAYELRVNFITQQINAMEEENGGNNIK